MKSRVFTTDPLVAVARTTTSIAGEPACGRSTTIVRLSAVLPARTVAPDPTTVHAMLEPSAPRAGTETLVRTSETFGMLIASRSRCALSASATSATTFTG
ncbi:hypothetical protein Q0F99_06225 [Rathayibacter oskolensis]|nr:hypothetical protein [Rathayibacter oskolensis]WKK72536.1 hypothetical protein Q0F99_06225 [Rathayibacter oskolensis]